MNVIKINGREFKSESKMSIKIEDDDVYVDGEHVGTNSSKVIIVQGDVETLDTCDSVIIEGNVNGDISASDCPINVKGNVEGDIDCSDISCASVTGNITTDGDVNCASVVGDIDCADINCASVKGNISANGDVNMVGKQ